MLLGATKFGESADAHTEHNALLTSMSRIHFRASWWEYNYALSCAYCLLCSRPIGAKIGVTDAMFASVVEHERCHIDALGAEKVAAAEALYLIESEEARSQIVGFHQPTHAEHFIGSYVSTIVADGPPEITYAPPPSWKSVIEEVWGCIPNAVLPPTEGP